MPVTIPAYPKNHNPGNDSKIRFCNLSRTQIIVRADSGFCREEVLAWCEAQKLRASGLSIAAEDPTRNNPSQAPFGATHFHK
jgi:hypothetical protein